MRALIVGMGSIGQRHAKNLRHIIPNIEIVALRHKDKANIKQLANYVFTTLSDVLDYKPDLAIIANPSTMHIPIAIELAKQSIPIFIEKPISSNLEHIDTLLELCHSKNIPLLVGYQLRFYKPLQILHDVVKKGKIGKPLYFRSECGQFLPDWRLHSDYKDGVSANSNLGGGVILEISHELDYACWIMGKVASVQAQAAKLSNLELDVEDTAEILLEFENGSIGSVHINMIERPHRRCCRIIGEDASVEWNWDTHKTRLIMSEGTSEDLISFGNDWDFNNIYLKEMRHFISCVQGTASPLISGETGKYVLEIALAIKQSAKSGLKIKL